MAGVDSDPITVRVARTKLRPPPVRGHVQERTRLRATLERCVLRPVTLVSAPAGYGKTTALAAWARARRPPVAWLALDEHDAHPLVFLRHLLAALTEIEARAGELEATEVEAALVGILNAFDAASGVRIVVLDDLHTVAVPEVHDLLRRLVERAPEALRLVLATRVDPALPLARWRLSGDLSELRAAELAFDVDEARAMLSGMGLALDEEALATLVQRTEGWGAGLQLAGLSLRGRRREGQRDYVERFTGRDRYVLDYLTEEVLQRLAPGLQDFLLMVSVLDAFDGPTAAAVTGRSDALEVLLEVERANLFLHRVDDRTNLFRFHPIFRDLLSGRLADLRPELPDELRARARTHADQVAARRQASLRETAPVAAAASGSSVLRPAPTDADSTPVLEPLSDREREVMRWLATGASNKAIARHLGLSPNTVKTHLKRSFEKLAVANRTAAVARARELDLV